MTQSVGGQDVLRGQSVPITVSCMKTEQVRISVEVCDNARVVAAALGKSLPKYVEECMRFCMARDFPKVQKIVNKKAAEASKPTEAEQDGKS